MPDASNDCLISRKTATRLAGDVSLMTIWRWRRLGLIPQPIKIRSRNYWHKAEFLRALESAARSAP